MNLTVIPVLRQMFGEQVDKVGKHESIDVPQFVRNVIVIDQDPIGRTPRSNPATYTKLFDEIRRIFASTKEAKARGYKEGRFSFNVKGGRCETCQGDGVLRIEMNFLPDVYVQCSDCKGKRYNKETLSILFKGKNIAEVLDMTVEEAAKFFENTPRISRKLTTLLDVGLATLNLVKAQPRFQAEKANASKSPVNSANTSLGTSFTCLTSRPRGFILMTLNG